MRARQVITNTNPMSPISEQYRSIRTNLQFTAIDRDIKSIVITSSEPGDGKSITTANLAVVYAQQGKKVLLIDADLRKPTMHFTFRVDNIRGLSNYLVSQNELKEVIVSSRLPNIDLDIMPAGPIPPNPAELLGSKASKRLIEEATQDYDLVIFDTPPALAVTDACVLANVVDGTILVIRSKKTHREAGIKAKERLEQAQANILGTVLNGKDIKNSHYYYYGTES